MVVWCNKCNRYVNQVCDRCGESFGEIYCEKYACGGKMMCPRCHGYEIETSAEHKKKEQMEVDKYDFSTRRKMGVPAEGKGQQAGRQAQACPSCGFKIDPSWNYCPNCGVSFKLKSR